MEALQQQLALAVDHAPGRVGIAVEDLATGYVLGINAGANLPAASTIKIPVMVEVFKQMQDGDIDLNTVVHLEASDRDWGWGDMADAPLGTARTVKQLLWLMITNSDNTATNMLIRLVGGRNSPSRNVPPIADSPEPPCAPVIPSPNKSLSGKV